MDMDSVLAMMESAREVARLRVERDEARREVERLRAEVERLRAEPVKVATRIRVGPSSGRVTVMLAPDMAPDEILVACGSAAFARVQAGVSDGDRLADLARHARDRRLPLALAYHPDADPGDGSGWVCEVDDWSTHAGTLDAVIIAACDRLGVSDD